MKGRIIVTKVGGKILESDENLDHTLNQFRTLIYEKKIIDTLIIIPGGGSYANFIRNIDKKLGIGDDLSHWMAIMAMNYNGEKINKKYSALKCIKDIKEVQENEGSILVFLPYDYLYRKDELPHSWYVTSDSISLYVARKLGLNESYLIKDVDGIILHDKNLVKELSVEDYKKLRESKKIKLLKTYQESLKLKTTPIDSYLLQLLVDYDASCVILNGSFDSKNIVSYFDEEICESDKIYSKIKGIT
jgi:aspartokinase-like uncharacterized kinase